METDESRAEVAVPKRPAVFLDRDGTISEEVGYVNHIDRLQIFPWTAEAIRKLNRAGLLAIVVTNQSGVGRGYFPDELVVQIHYKISRELQAQGARIDAFYYCPHHPEARIEALRAPCRCRKPLPGMLEDAAERFHLDLGSSYLIGDSLRDMETAWNAGARPILVMTGYGRGNLEYLAGRSARRPDLVAENLLEAVEKILAELKPSASAAR
jgi:D-glycero-D-manno-heptose 1,7-bisphosphate phosphatase